MNCRFSLKVGFFEGTNGEEIIFSMAVVGKTAISVLYCMCVYAREGEGEI